MKKLFIIFTTLLLISTGCSDISEKGVIQNKTTTHYEKTFDYLNGTEKIDMKLPKNANVKVNVDYSIDEGSVDFKIIDDKNKVVDDVTNSESITFKTGDSKYYLVIEAKEAKGSFQFDWDE